MAQISENVTEPKAAKTSKKTSVEEGVPGPKKWNKAVDRFSYKGVVKNIPFLAFITLLALLYIANNNHAIALVRNIDQKKEELKKLHWRYMDLQSRLMYETSESQLKKRTITIGLKPLSVPDFEIKVNDK